MISRELSSQGEDNSPQRGICHVFNGNFLPELSYGTYLCKVEVWEDSPPKEEAIVLNSTCFIVGVLASLV
jgi:hypothetical protein